MTTTGWMDSWRALEAPTTCRWMHSWRALQAPGAPKPMNLAAWGLGWGLGPHGGPRAPRGGPCQHTHSGVPVSARTISDGSVGTTIRMAKEMWFLRLLLECPGFRASRFIKFIFSRCMIYFSRVQIKIIHREWPAAPARRKIIHREWPAGPGEK